MADHPLARYAALLQRLPELHDGLRGTQDVGEFLARGVELACAETAFARGVVVAVRDGVLSTDVMDAMRDEDADRLRRRILARPPALRPGTLEAELVRRPARHPEPSEDLPSVLAEDFGLEDPAFAVIAPESTVVGLLVLDSPGTPVDAADRSVVTLFGRMLSVVMEHVVLRARIAELSSELRYLTVSAQALADEAFTGPISMPVHGRHLPRFRSVDGHGGTASPVAQELLSDRELTIAALVAEGRSNPEIAAQLYLSTETVKDAVSRIARKLGAANRVEIAVRFLGLAPRPPAGGRGPATGGSRG